MTTRDAILDAAEALTQRRGANSVSYADISAVVGIRKASIHHHFPSKDDLLQALIARYSERFFDRLQQIAAQDIPAMERLHQVGRLFQYTREDRRKVCLCGMLGAEVETLCPEAAALVKEFFVRGSTAIGRLLEEGREGGEFTFRDEADVLGAALFSFLEGGSMVSRAGGKSFDRMIEQLFGLLVK